MTDLSLVPPTVGPRFPRHDGSAPGQDDDFVVLPDPAIGEVRSAGTNRSVRGYRKGSGPALSSRVLLAFLGLFFGAMGGFLVARIGVETVLDLLEVRADNDILSGVGFLGMAVTSTLCMIVGFFFPLLFRRPLVTYAGSDGLMRYSKGLMGGERRELLRFADADTLTVGRTRHFYNGSYTGTSYDYRWFRSGASKFRIQGRYRDDVKNPIDPVNFAFAAENAWTRHRLRQVQDQIAREGLVRFRVGPDWIGVGNGFIEIGWKGAVERLEKSAIAALSLAQGTLTVKRHGAKEGLFRSEGVFRFPVSAMADFRVFLVALEVCTGFHFD